MWASILILVIYTVNLGFYLAKHGEIEEKEYNFLKELIASIISLYILYCAGAFNSLIG